MFQAGRKKGLVVGGAELIHLNMAPKRTPDCRYQQLI